MAGMGVSIVLLIIIWKFVNVKDHRYDYANNNNSNKDSNNGSNNDLINDHNNKNEARQKQEQIQKNNKDMNGDLDLIKKNNNVGIEHNKIKKPPLDIKGAITLAVAIVSILL